MKHILIINFLLASFTLSAGEINLSNTGGIGGGPGTDEKESGNSGGPRPNPKVEDDDNGFINASGGGPLNK